MRNFNNTRSATNKCNNSEAPHDKGWFLSLVTVSGSSPKWLSSTVWRRGRQHTPGGGGVWITAKGTENGIHHGPSRPANQKPLKRPQPSASNAGKCALSMNPGRKQTGEYLPVSDRKHCPSIYSPYRWRTKLSLNRNHMTNECLAVTKMHVHRLSDQHRDSDLRALVVLRIELAAWIKLCQVLMHRVQLVTTRPTQHRCLLIKSGMLPL